MFDRRSECKTCIQGQFSRLPYRKENEGRENTEIWQIVHGPFRVESPGGSWYFVTFIDDANRYTRVYVIEHKNRVIEKFKEYKNEVENEMWKRIKYFQCDNGVAECRSKEVIYYLSVVYSGNWTTPYKTQQNGLAERKKPLLSVNEIIM